MIPIDKSSVFFRHILELAGGDGEKKEAGGGDDEEDPEVNTYMQIASYISFVNIVIC